MTRVQAGTQDAAEVAALLAEEHVELVPEGDRDKLRVVDSLTGQPRVDDILLFALPVRGVSLCILRRAVGQDVLYRCHFETHHPTLVYGII